MNESKIKVIPDAHSKTTGKRTSSGKSTSYYLTLFPWGPRASSNKTSVSRSFYKQVQTGEPACVSLRKGALHMPWYVVGKVR